MRKILFVATIIPLLTFQGLAQEQEKTGKYKQVIYSFVPQYLINKGFRIDIEKQITPRSLIQFCPQFYLGEKANNPDSYSPESSFGNNDFQKLIGGGLNVYHKIFANKEDGIGGAYIAYGVSYNYFEIDYLDTFLNSTINAAAKIQKYGVDLIIGYQLLLKNNLSLDLYTGIGTRNSNMDTNAGNNNRFNTDYYGYNYSGNMMHLGLRIGIQF